MSKRARENREAYEAKHYPERWQDDRDAEDDDNDRPEPEEPEPIHTLH